MGIGVSIFLIAVGAILTFAVTVTANGVNISTVGMILMIVGGIGLLWSLIAVGTSSYRGRTVYEGGPVVERRVVRDDF